MKRIIVVLFVLIFSNIQAYSELTKEKDMEKATFGAGCFWCVEAVFERVKGVNQVESGYSGGEIKDPTYNQVASGQTKYTEAVQLTFDPGVISYEDLLEIFWKTHDPTQLNRQGADVGPQYRSVIFYHNQKQKELAEQYKQKLNDAGIWDKPIVTAIEAYKNFFVAEDYHQNYYENNKNKGYCQIVITPKLKKFEKIFGDKLKE
ncbi:MAG: peptide-methionine (S)-S-oxide reductase MsrA [Bacteroidales bacterium]|nr:peptide-methionine (S)-S-oxide reductase MsrA [Bacteroidales bacterium]